MMNWQVLLAEPNPEDPLVPEIANMFRSCFPRCISCVTFLTIQSNVARYKREGFEEKAKMMTKKHAGTEGGEKEETKIKRVCENDRGGEKKIKI